MDSARLSSPVHDSPRVNLYALSFERLAEQLAAWGHPRRLALALWRAVYSTRVSSLDDIPELPDGLRSRLTAQATLGSAALERETLGDDGETRKWLLRLADGELVETVLMRHQGRMTACISTQAGCAMGCVFCATGQMGFARHLAASEIVEQVVRAARRLDAEGKALRNVVLMGMGEPLHNYVATMAALDILLDQRGMSLAPRHLTLSTVGLVPAIRRLADDGCPVRLAVSLHASTDEARDRLLPVNRRWPLAELMDACRYYSAKARKRVLFEWAVVEGTNDSPEQAHALGRLLKDLDAQVNLIPLNPTSGYDGRPGSPEAVRAFRHILSSYGIPSTVRIRRGIDIDAGCGQLREKAEG